MKILRLSQSTITVGLLAVLLLCKPCSICAQPASVVAAAAADRNGATLVRFNSLCQQQVSLSEVALLKSSNAAVKANATAVVNACNAAVSQIAQVSSAAAIPNSAAPGLPSSVVQGLGNLSAAAFDKPMLQQLIHSERIMIRELKVRGLVSTNGQIVTLSTQLLPVFQNAITASEGVYSQL